MHAETKTILYEIIQGNESAFRHFFDLYHQRLIHLAIYYLKSKELAEEAVADVFFNIWKKKEILLSIEDINRYLYVSVKNQSINYIRRSNPANKDVLDIYEVEWLPDSNNPEERLLEEEYRKLIQKAILSLPPKCREVFRLIFADKLKYKEIAILLDISEKMVEKHAAKAYKRIAEYVNKEYHNPDQAAAISSIFF